MSVYPTLINCSHCSFKSSISRVYGIFKYLLPNNQKITAERTIGWCHACNNIEPIELFPDASQLNNEKTNINGQLKGITRFSISRLYPSTKRNIAHLKSKLQELENIIYFLSIRKSPPLCLTCGSQEIFQINFFSDEKEIKHPGCGGKLITQKSDFRISYRFSTRLYDFEGKRIHKNNL